MARMTSDGEGTAAERFASGEIEWLLGEEGSGWLKQTAEWLEAEGGAVATAALVGRLRKQHSGERARMLLWQCALRRKAREKFARPAGMFFTRRGLEQASDEVVAGYKAERFRAGVPRVDLCAGVGGDLGALAAGGPAVGIERDALLARFAGVNARQLAGRVGWLVEARCTEVGAEQVAAGVAWHADPDRRVGGRRGVRVEDHDPPREVFDALLARSDLAGIKLAPAGKLPADWESRAEREWISREGECKQQVAWFGALARVVGGRSATVLRGGERRTVCAPAGWMPAREDVGAITDGWAGRRPALGRYVYEPDAAVIAAGLVERLAEELGVQAVDTRIAYLTGDERREDLAASSFEVLEVAPFEVRRWKALVRARRMGWLEVKKRGVDLDPARVVEELAVPGEERGTLLVARFGSRVWGVLARRVG